MTASIRLKLIVPLVGGLALIAVSTAVLMRFVHQRAVDQAAEHEVEQASEALAAQEAQEIDRLTALLEALATDRALADALQRQDKAALLAEARPVFERLRDEHGVTHWYLYGPDVSQGVLLRVHRPELGGDVVRRPTLRRAVETGQTASGRELGRTAFAVRVVRPWRLDGKLIGYVELGTDLHTFLTRLKRMTDDEYGLLLDKRELEPAAWALVTGHPERWDDRPELVAVASTDGREEIFAGLGRVADIPPRPALLQRLVRDGRTLTRAAFPLRGDGGKVIGAVTVLHDITPLLAGADQIRVRVVIVVVLLAAALAALVIFLLETLVFDRIERMSKSLEELPDRLARGEYHRVELVPRADDEIGRFEAFLDRAIMAIGSFVTDARRVPTGRHPTVRRIDRDEP
ncbi:MAG TPA: cache domain-containing protein [Anaeromyxobacteraceae bacterium]|nr:cache domain-containing protein [Anaeromyxobacteraceae bacterium]